MYKDREKQREAQRAWIAKKRAKAQNKTHEDCVGLTNSVEPDVNVEPFVEPELSNPLPANFGQPSCECKHCQQNRTNKSKLIINHGQYKPRDQLAANEVNRVSLPGDVDYV